MDQLHHLSETIAATRPGIVSFCISIFSAALALLNATVIHVHFPAFIYQWVSLRDLQSMFAIAASCVAMISGGFCIYYYKIQIKKVKNA